MKNREYKNQKGLTLIELMTTISIILIISFFIFPNYQNMRKELALQRVAHKIAQDLRRTQESAMSAKCSPCEIFFNADEEDSYEVLGNIVNLEKWVKIKSLSPISLEDELAISFSPPSPTTSINGVTSGLDAEITISNDIHQKSVKINNVGRIEIGLTEEIE